MAMLEVKDLQVYYGVIQALKGISFHVNQGEVIALIGANGAGKTTTLQTLTGILSPKSGSIVFEGKDLTRTPAHKIVEMGMAHVPEGRRVFADMSVYENLLLGAYTRRIRQRSQRALPVYTRDFRVWKNVKDSVQELFPVVSSRCLHGACTDEQTEDHPDG